MEPKLTSAEETDQSQLKIPQSFHSLHRMVILTSWDRGMNGCELYYCPIGGSVAEAGWEVFTCIVFASDSKKK